MLQHSQPEVKLPQPYFTYSYKDGQVLRTWVTKSAKNIDPQALEVIVLYADKAKEALAKFNHFKLANDEEISYNFLESIQYYHMN